LTRQTNQGRANDGGLKIGEMERDGIMAHGLSYFLNESYMIRGDQYFMGICNKTGSIAIYNPNTNLFLSPFADGPLVFNKNLEGQEVLNAISKFGRSFSIVRIPFALKLLIQELQVMNIQMRIITEDNIDQLMNLSYQSRNIDKLLNIDHGESGEIKRDIKEIIENYKKTLDNLIVRTTKINTNKLNEYDTLPLKEELEYTPESPEYAPPESPAYAPSGSPAYAPSGSPAYAPSESPEYAPPESPAYAPSGSPEYAPESPEYAPPKSPNYPPPKGGATNLFPNKHMNLLFNNLSPSIQSQILNLNHSEQISVMMGIMKQNASQNMNTINETTILPTSMADELYKKLPILAVESDTITDSTTDSTTESSSNTTSDTTIGSIKKVSIS
jgi:hypothetical protein